MEYKVFVPTMTDTNEVETNEIATLADYRQVTSSEDFSLLLRLAERFEGKRLLFFSSTIQGGGVALMRHALMRLFKLLDVDAHWHVLFPDECAFVVTKRKFHNVLQSVADEQVVLTEEDKACYQHWIAENARLFKQVFRKADVIVIDDPQPCGLIPFIKRANPSAKIIYRSHIQIMTDLVNQPGTPQQITWDFLWQFIQEADCFVSHPIPDFVPAEVPKEKVVLMPATTDPLNGLNKPLGEDQMLTYLNIFNDMLFQEHQQPLDLNRPYIIQVARFDPSKGIDHALEAFRRVRAMLTQTHQPLPQLLLVGNTSIDDPDAQPIYCAIRKLLRTEPYASLAGDVKMGRLVHIDEILNTLLRKSSVALQLSLREGFEIKVTEALMKGKPVVAYKSGGIPLQIQDGVDGFLVEVGNTEQVATHLFDVLTRPDLYRKMSRAAACFYTKDYLSPSNAICWLFLSLWITENGPISGSYQSIKELARQALLR